MSATPTAPNSSTGRPPVEHRLLGLDRRTLRLPMIAVAILLLGAVVAPAIDSALDYDQPVEAGDVFVIGPATTIAPPTGWDVQAGIRLRDDVRVRPESHARLVVSGSGVTVSTQTGPFAGDAHALNTQVLENFRLASHRALTVKGKAETISVDGEHGVARRFRTLGGEGGIFTFVREGIGLQIVLTGTTDALEREATALGRMIATVDFDRQER